MEIVVKDLGRCIKEIAVVVPPALIDVELDKALATAAKQVVIPGFRPGKTPRSMIEKRFGEEICKTVAGDLAQRALAKAVDEHKLELVSEARLKSDHMHAHRGEPMNLTFEVEVKAEFEVAGYRGLELKRELKPVEEKELDEVVDTLRRRNATYDAVEDGLRKGDWVVASIRAEVEGKTVYDRQNETISSTEGARILDFDVAELDSKLEGARTGDVRTLEGVVSDLFDDEALRGKPATVSVTVAQVSREKLPEIDDALAAKAGKSTLAELRTELRSKLEASHEAEADRAADEFLIDQLVAKIAFEMAASPVERAIESRMERISRQLKAMGRPESESTAEVEKRREEIAKAVERDARAWLIFEKIAKKEKIFALEDDVAREFERLAREHGHTPSEVRRHYEEKDLVGDLRAEILEKKVREFLRAQAVRTASDGAAGAAGA